MIESRTGSVLTDFAIRHLVIVTVGLVALWAAVLREVAAMRGSITLSRLTLAYDRHSAPQDAHHSSHGAAHALLSCREGVDEA